MSTSLNIRKRKNYFDSSRRNRYIQKDLINCKANDLSSFCLSLGLKIKEIVLAPDDEDEFTPISSKLTILPYEVTDERIIFQSLMAKDLAHVSNKHYYIFRKTLSDIQRMPGIDKILELKTKLDNFFDIKKNEFGFFCSPKQKIRYVCQRFLSNNTKFTNKCFRIKLSIDSTSISTRNITLLNVSFNLIDDTVNSMNINGTFLLGSFEIIKENYEQVKESTKELLHLVEEIKSIKIKQKVFEIIFFLCCDYKMLRICYGFKAANSLEG